jgi:hypothetical protein
MLISQLDLDEKFPALYETIWTRFTCADGYEVFSDVFDTLKELKSRKITLGVISNSDERVGKKGQNKFACLLWYPFRSLKHSYSASSGEPQIGFIF